MADRIYIWTSTDKGFNDFARDQDMADRYEFLPDRFTSRARAIDDWKAGRGTFPPSEFDNGAITLEEWARRRMSSEEVKESVGLWRTMVDMVPWRRLVGM